MVLISGILPWILIRKRAVTLVDLLGSHIINELSYEAVDQINGIAEY